MNNDFMDPNCQYIDVTWTSWRLKPLTTQLFGQQRVQAKTKNSSMVRYCGP